jgi:hypothetical protein
MPSLPMRRWPFTANVRAPSGRARRPADDAAIVVCARRDADRYRVPLVSTVRPGSTPERIEQMVTGPIGEARCGQGPFMVHCGSVGVKMRVGSDGKARYVRRELAP